MDIIVGGIICGECGCKYLKSDMLLLFYFCSLFRSLLGYTMDDWMLWIIVFASVILIGVFVSLRSRGRQSQTIDGSIGGVVNKSRSGRSNVPTFDKERLVERIRRRKQL